MWAQRGNLGFQGIRVRQCKTREVLGRQAGKGWVSKRLVPHSVCYENKKGRLKHDNKNPSPAFYRALSEDPDKNELSMILAQEPPALDPLLP